jgi:hypothetical protein
MAQGDIIIFDQFLLDLGEKIHDLSSDTFKLGLVNSATTPATTTGDPRWGAGGTTNFDTNEVTAGGNYTAEGATLAGVTSVLSGGKAVFDANDVTFSQNASNPTNARWGIVYNNTDAGKRCLFAVDLGSVFDMTTGDLVITWNASGIFDTNQV